MSAPVRVLVLDDDPFVCNSICWLLTPTLGFQVVGETGNIAELPALCVETRSHLLLIGGDDIALFREIALLTQVLAAPPRLVALLSGPPAPPLAPLLEIPLHGCCFKAQVSENLLHVLHAVVGGDAWFSRAVLKHQSSPKIHAVLAEQGVELSESEEQIVVLLADGLSNGEIAHALNRAESTVRNAVKSIYSKLDTHNRVKVALRFQGSVFEPWGK